MFKKEKTQVGLSSPWISYVHKIETLFKEDPEVTVVYDDNKKDIKIFVEESIKAEALTQLLPTEKKFGEVTITIRVIPANNIETDPALLFEEAFDGNPIFDGVLVIKGMYNNPVNYIIFTDKIAQYWDDNLGDPYGNISTLYQEIARDVFDIKGVQYCTKAVD